MPEIQVWSCCLCTYFSELLDCARKTKNNRVCSLLRPRIQRSRKVVLGLAHPGQTGSFYRCRVQMTESYNCARVHNAALGGGQRGKTEVPVHSALHKFHHEEWSSESCWVVAVKYDLRYRNAPRVQCFEYRTFAHDVVCSLKQ